MKQLKVGDILICSHRVSIITHKNSNIDEFEVTHYYNSNGISTNYTVYISLYYYKNIALNIYKHYQIK